MARELERLPVLRRVAGCAEDKAQPSMPVSVGALFTCSKRSWLSIARKSSLSASLKTRTLAPALSAKLRSTRRDGAAAGNGDGFAFDLKKNRKLLHGSVLTVRALFRVHPKAS